MGRLIYLGYYGMPTERRVSPASVAVMDTVIRAMQALGHPPLVISPARPTTGRTDGGEEWPDCIYTVPEEPAAGKHPRGILLALGTGVLRGAAHLCRARALERTLLREVRDGDTVVVYHSLRLMSAVRRLCRRRRVRLILQVCEVYADAEGKRASSRARRAELAYLRRADGYIFSSEPLAALLGNGKPYAVCLGDYRMAEPTASPILPCDGRTLHAVYAGTLEPRKGGAALAVQAAAHLPAGYHVHILGFGTPDEVARIRGAVAEVNAVSAATVTYDGLRTGAAYRAHLAACSIGLATQEPTGVFNATSFPSKILSYMAHGLEVVSTRVPAVVTSAVGEEVTFCDATPVGVARAMVDVANAPSTRSPSDKLTALDDALRRDLARLLCEEESL